MDTENATVRFNYGVFLPLITAHLYMGYLYVSMLNFELYVRALNYWGAFLEGMLVSQIHANLMACCFRVCFCFAEIRQKKSFRFRSSEVECHPTVIFQYVLNWMET